MSINIEQIYGSHNIIKYPKANKTKTVYETFLMPNNIHKIFNIKDTIHYKSLVSNNYNDYDLCIDLLFFLYFYFDQIHIRFSMVVYKI